jgi:hypothetical protein
MLALRCPKRIDRPFFRNGSTGPVWQTKPSAARDETSYEYFLIPPSALLRQLLHPRSRPRPLYDNAWQCLLNSTFLWTANSVVRRSQSSKTCWNPE